MKPKEFDVVKQLGDWFMYFNYYDTCPHCEEEIDESMWVNIDKAVKKIKESERE